MDPICEVGESPLWIAALGAIAWIDLCIESKLLLYHVGTGELVSWRMPGVATALCAGPSAHSVCMIVDDVLCEFDLAAGAVTRRRTLPLARNMRFNDSGVDGRGRLWTGTMFDNVRGTSPSSDDWPQIGRLMKIDASGTESVGSMTYGCPNTFCWSPDERLFYNADSISGAIYRYAFDAETGTVGDRSTLICDDLPGIPDGTAIDSDGCLWNARWSAGRVLCITGSGSIAAIVTIEAANVTSCCFGEADLSVLYITTAREPGRSESSPAAGALFRVETGRQGFSPRAIASDIFTRN